MHIFGDGPDNIGQVIKTIKARYDYMIENDILPEGDKEIIGNLLENLASDKFLRLIVHCKDDISSEELSITDVLYHEKYYGKNDTTMEMSSIHIMAIDSNIEFGKKDIRQTVETAFGKTRNSLIVDTDKEFENFDIEKHHVFIRTVTRCVLDKTTDLEQDEVYNELHFYQPKLSPTIPIE